MRTVREWLNAFQSDCPSIIDRTRQIYGENAGILQGRRELYIKVLNTFSNAYGETEKALIVRAPGRINLLGTHIDHRGGYVNYMAIDREMILIASPREDDKVVLHNVDAERFGPREFHISEKFPPNQKVDWFEYIEQNGIPPGNWANYISAGVLYVQHLFSSVTLKGMNVAVAGDVPIGAGLSSSSTLVVTALEAVLVLNGLKIPHQEKAVRCGEAEWYVGTRGGAGDHAAMLYAKRQAIARLRFFPLQIEDVPFPAGYRVVACNSFVEHASQSIFNERIAAYEIGMMLLKKHFPQFASQLQHLRDVHSDNLSVPPSQIYRMIKTLPERISRVEVKRQLPGQAEALGHLFHSHDAPIGGYRVRGVCFFGIAECARSEFGKDMLIRGEMEAFGKLKYISHNGDRVVTHRRDGAIIPSEAHLSDFHLDSLIADLESGDDARIQSAQIPYQPGRYQCSCEELDQLVDLAKQVDGVVGAGLSGGGLGGCILVIVQEQAVDDLLKTVKRGYYDPKGLPLGTVVCSSVEGAGKF